MAQWHKGQRQLASRRHELALAFERLLGRVLDLLGEFGDSSLVSHGS
jgi:hypothetical protein